MMEEATEGAVSLKKCLKGDGPIYLDSDEAALQGDIAFARRKKAKVSRGGKHDKTGSAPLADGHFVGVKLNAQGKPERVYLE